MSLAYENVRKAILLRAGQIADAATAAAFETAFNAALATAVGGMEVPLTGLTYAILASEKRIAALCGRSKNPILRAPLYGKTASIAHLGLIPTTSSASKQFVGNFGNVLDASTNEPLTEKPKTSVLRDVRMYTAGTLKIRPMHFCFEDTRVLHTRANVYLEGCVWDYATQLTAYGAAGSSPLDQSLETMLIADVLANMVQENWLSQEGAYYGRIVEKCEADIKNGLLPQAVLPDATANSNPVPN
jgi:hypothetical protein